MGEASLIARAVYPGGQTVRSAPLPIRVREPALIAPVAAEGPADAGLAVVVQDASGGRQELVVGQLDGAVKELAKTNAKGSTILLTGLLKAARPGFHQLAISSDGQLKVSLHGKVVADATLASGGPETFVPVGLQAGWHPIEIELRPAGRRPFLKVVMAGEQVPGVLGKGNLAH
jgi:hypothetical protein